LAGCSSRAKLIALTEGVLQSKTTTMVPRRRRRRRRIRSTKEERERDR
jgi:hypothetical protein